MDRVDTEPQLKIISKNIPTAVVCSVIVEGKNTRGFAIEFFLLNELTSSCDSLLGAKLAVMRVGL